MDVRASFYKQSIAAWIEDRSASVLVVGGGPNDREVFRELGFTNVVLSNLDSRMKGDEFAPYRWSFQDAENLGFKDEEFDYAVAYASLHHCYSPHRALLEMYRVARRAVIFLESRDSAVMRVLHRLNVTPVYEHTAVFHNDGRFGGVANSDIPNYVYRWTEREVEKTILTFSPVGVHRFEYRYGFDPPCTPAFMQKRGLKQLLVGAALPAYRLFVLLFPRQQNLFAARVVKPVLPRDLHPWLVLTDGKSHFNMEWGRKHYHAREPEPPGAGDGAV